MAQVAQGGIYTWNATIRDGNGDLADAPDLTLTIADPQGDELVGFPVAIPPIIHDSLGEYHYDWEVDDAATLGTYDADWAGTVDGLAVGGSDSVEVVVAGSISPFLSYATVTDVQTELNKVETDERVIERMRTALVATTQAINDELRFDFFRHPSDGETTWFVKGKGSLIHAHAGIVSVSLIRIRTSRLGSWIELAETDYDLEAWASDDDPGQEEAESVPYDHIRLNGTGSYSVWPQGYRLIELTGVRGWPAYPRRAIEANVEWTRQSIAADRTYPGGVISPDEAGLPVLPSRLPDSVYRLKRWSLDRFACAV